MEGQESLISLRQSDDSLFMAKQQFPFPSHHGSFMAIVPDSSKGNFAIRLSHVPGTDNSIADALSRSQ